MRVAFCAHDAVNANYRAYFPAVELGERGHWVRCHIDSQVRTDPDLLRQCEVVVFYRHCDDASMRLAQWLSEQGVAVVWDNDDHFGGLPKEHPLGGLKGREIDGYIKRMLRIADIATAPSAELAARYAASGARCTAMVENYLPNESVPTARDRHDGCVVGWVAAGEHRSEVQGLDLPGVVARLLGGHPDLRVETVGLRLGLQHPRYIPREPVALKELPRAVARFDVGIAPLVDTPYNRARSNVKVKEYACAGVPWLASSLGPYGSLGEREGGRLVAEDGWEQAIGRLVESARDRRRLGRRAARWAKSQTIARNVERWEEVLAEAIERRAAQGVARRPTAAAPR